MGAFLGGKRVKLYKGIEVVGDVPSVNIYSTPQTFNQNHSKAMARQQKGLDTLNSIMPGGPQSSIGDIGLAATPNTPAGLFETKKALGKATQNASAKNKNKVLVYDTETFGTKGTDLFDVGQISLHEFDFDGNALKQSANEATVLAVGLGEDTAEKLNAAIRSLEENPNALFNFNDDLKRSLADLTLYDDKNYFSSQTMNGKPVATMTGQASIKPSTKGTALSQKDALSRMRAGLSNLTNNELTNDRQTIFSVLEDVARQNPVLAGHNVQSFDQPVMLDWMTKGGVQAPESVQRYFRKEQIDTLRLGREIYNQTELQSKNYQLSNLFNFVTGKGNGDMSSQAHFAGADTMMNGIVLNDEIMRAQKSGLATEVYDFINKGDTFISERGSGSFYENAFNRNAGQYDVTARWDDKTKKYVQNYQFQEAPVVAGHSYQYLGSAKDVDINGVKHYSMVMQDLDNQTIKTIFREDQTQLTDMLTNNYTKINKDEVGTPGYLSRKEFIKEDNARRHYDSLFDPKMRNDGDTVSKRLEKSYKVLDMYAEQEKNGLTGHKAIQAVQDKLNIDKSADDMYRNSYENIEKTVRLKDRLLQERSAWQESIASSQKLFPMSENKIANNQAQNLFISNIQKEMNDLRPDAKKDYTYNGMKVLPLTSQKGEITYMDVSSKTALKSRVSQTLRVSDERGRGTVMRDFENMLNQIGGTMDDTTIMELKTKVQKDISISGRVEPGTMNFVNNKIYSASNKSEAVVSAVPGKNIYAARNDGTSESTRYLNALSSKEDKFFSEVMDRAKTRTVNSLSSESTRTNFQNFDLNNLSEAASQRIKKSAEIVQFFDERVTSTAGVYGLDHGQRKKKTSSLDYNKRIKETVKSFEDNNFVVNLDYLPDSDDMVLFFTPQDSGALLSGMSVNEKRGHKRVHSVSIPLMNDDASVNINGTGVTMQYKASYAKDKGLKGPNMVLRSTPEKAFDRIQTIPHNIVKTMETHQQSGQKVDTDSIIEKQIASYRHAITSGQSSSSFAGDLNPEQAWAASSRGKNIASGLTVDISDFGDVVLEREHPDAFREFQTWQKRNGKEHVNFISSGFNPKKEAFSVRNSVMNQLSVRWNEEYGTGTDTGVQITRQGLNPKQFSSGKGLAMDPRMMTPLGELNPATREQILKTQNYQPMNRESLENYMSTVGGVTNEHALERRFLGGVTSLSDDYNSLSHVNPQQGVTGVGVRTAFMGQDEIQQGVDKAIVNVRKEIEQLTAKKSTTSGSQSTDIQDQIEKLQGAETELMSGRFATTDGQMVVSESLAKSMKSESQMGIRVKTGYQLPDEINSRIAARTNGEAFTNGILKFDAPMSYKEMQDTGLLTKDGMLTVGNLVEETVKEEASDMLGDNSQLYRVYENSQILGIQRSPKGDKLILNQVTQAKNGSKFVDGFLGTRNTLSVMGDTAYEQFAKAAGVAGVQTIQEPINVGRNSWGGILSTTIETTFENAMEDLDKVQAGGKSSVPAVQRFLDMQKDKGISVQDLSRAEITSNFMEDVFKHDLNLSGAGGIIGLNKEGNRLVYGSVNDLNGPNGNPLIGANGQANYTNFLNKATSDYNFSDKNVQTQMRSHNVVEYAGTTTRAKLSVREMNILKSKLTRTVEVPDGNGGMKTIIERAEDNPIMQKFERLMNNGAKEDHLDLARRIEKAHPFLGEGDNLSGIHQPNNVIMDMTGSFQGNANQNVIMGKNGEMIFDASSLGELPSSSNRTKANMQGTMADPMSIILNNEELGISNETLGDYQKRTGGQSFLKIGNPGSQNEMGTGQYKKNYIPLIGNMDDRFSDYEEANIRAIQKDTEDIYSNVYRYNNRDYSSQQLSHDEIAEKGMPHTRRANEAIDNLQQDVNRYTTNSRKSGLIKGTNTVRSKHGLSAKTGSYSFYDSYEQGVDGLFGNAGKRRESEFFVSTDNAKAMIDGLEEQIYQANGLNVGEMNKNQLQEDILRRLQGTRAEDEAFDVIGTVNRFPTQSEGSINFMSMRVDKAMDATNDKRAMIGNAAAKLMGADFDGDHIYTVLDLYRQNGQSAPELLRIQEAMMQERDQMENAAKAIRYEGESGSNAFKDITQMEKAKRDAFFANFSDDTNEALSTISSNVKSTGIGSMDNAMVANRNLLDTVYGHALSNGAIDARQYNEAIQSFGEVSDLTVQNFISAKKFTPEGVGISADDLQGLTGTERSDYILNKSQQYLNTQSELPNLLRNVNGSNVDDVMRQMGEIGVIGEGQEDLFRTALGHVAVAQEATAGYGGIRNAAFDVAKSNGSATGNIIEQLTNSPGSILPTEDMTRFVGSMFDNSSETSTAYFNSIEQTGAAISQNVARINARNNGSDFGFSQAAEQQLNGLSDLFKENHTARKNVTANEVLGTIQSKVSNIAGSTAFKVGAGFSAMWMLGSAIKSGPTPEGDEAVQEATPQQVNPAALLTSPTARVTPNGESIHLNISGSGNVNQEEVSGIVNGMVGQMTGVPMNTNVNVSDNTQELDRSFYEQAMGKILGV